MKDIDAVAFEQALKKNGLEKKMMQGGAARENLDKKW